MPTVAVYVPAALFRRLGSDEGRVRALSLAALEAADGGLAEREGSAVDGSSEGGAGSASRARADDQASRSASPPAQLGGKRSYEPVPKGGKK